MPIPETVTLSEAVTMSILAEADSTGAEWEVCILSAGLSQNGNLYTDDMLQGAADVFEGVKVFAYELKQGLRDHLPGELKTLFGDGGGAAKNLVGTVEGVHFAERNGRAGLFGTFKVIDEGLRSLMRNAWQLGSETARRLFGFSIDARAQVESTGDGTRKVLSFAPNPTLDVVSHPAAGGSLERLVASLSSPGDPTMADPTATAPEPTPEPAIEPAPVVDESAIMARIDRKIACREAVIDKITESGLPLPAQRRLRAELKRDFDTVAEAVKATDDAIAAERDYLAEVAPSPKVTDAGTTRESATQGVDSLDRLQVAMDGMMANRDMKLGDEIVPRFTSLHESYYHATGKIPGMDVGFEEMLRQGISYRGLPEVSTWGTRESRNLRPGQPFRRVTEAVQASTWGQILGDSVARAMQAEYARPDLQSWRKIVSNIESIKDFRTQRRMMLGGYESLSTVAESNNYPLLTSPGDDEETYAIAKRGGRERITLEAIADDDVGAVRRIPLKLGGAAAKTLFQAVFNVLTTNAAMYDTVALFNAGHGNSAALALNPENLRLSVVAMMDQTPYGDQATVQPLSTSNRPKTIIVPHELMHLAQSLTQGFHQGLIGGGASAATHAANAVVSNLPDFTDLDVVVVGHWTDVNNWYLAADPANTPLLEVGFWQGREEPELFVQDDPTQGTPFNADQIEYKIRHVYGVKALDWRGLYGQIVA